MWPKKICLVCPHGYQRLCCYSPGQSSQVLSKTITEEQGPWETLTILETSVPCLVSLHLLADLRKEYLWALFPDLPDVMDGKSWFRDGIWMGSRDPWGAGHRKDHQHVHLQLRGEAWASVSPPVNHRALACMVWVSLHTHPQRRPEPNTEGATYRETSSPELRA